ncbi:UBA/THIF-type NAD/FAD-binding protein [Candidatus Vecturithrix granuli]|uniref:UBA/THIF-type NAD/FAD-binding protein n=1 Tax=Vecturithrix granuli TaxID=1499967 RepID=A0A081BZI3_VECG1|nr:UBA/THIF-type NAD/FAD-binding protein [Candidatus Vecturithrix granuli]
MFERYARQLLFGGIGVEGQKKLSASCAVIIGCGALGTVIATSLARSGVGKIRIIDRDFIEFHNLQRQILFTEEDVVQQIPKAVAAERHLKRVNSSIEIEGVVADVNFTNIERLVQDADVILDGLDNFETRFLINDVSLKLHIPWVYGAAISSTGMSRTILPGETSCFRCLLDTPPGRGQVETCDTVGVLNPAPMIIGSFEAVEAMKILVGSGEINRDFLIIDFWEGTFEKLTISHDRNCPVMNRWRADCMQNISAHEPSNDANITNT